MAEIRGLDAWVRTLSDQDLPTLNTVVKDICELSHRDSCRAEDLTNIILRDANLTSRVLQIANSVHYNFSFTPIKTVSRGIVQLGFDKLRNITLAATLIDAFLKGKSKLLLTQSLAKSFHAAVQAKALVPLLSTEHKEQVFIAALLNNIGELALLATGRDIVEHFINERNLHPEKEHQLAQDFLGTDLNQISKALMKEWALLDLMRDSHDSGAHRTLMTKAVGIGNELSKQINKGLNSSEMQKLYAQIAQLNDITVEAARDQVKTMAEEASVIAKSYGAEALLPALPNMQEIDEVDSSTQQDEITDPESTTQSNLKFQQMLNQMHQMLFAGSDLSKILLASVKALHEGANIARVAIAMVDYKSKALDVRYIAGKGTQAWRQHAQIELDKLHKGELLHDVLRTQERIWYQPHLGIRDLGALKALAAQADIFLAPLTLNKRLVALIYADNHDKHLTEFHYENFQLATNQLQLMLTYQAK